MITYKDIDKRITEMLLGKFPSIEVTENDVREGFNRPSFFVQLDNPIRDTRLYLTERSLTVRIYFFPSDRRHYSLEVLEMQDSLESLFNLNFAVKDRIFTINETRNQVIDGVLEFDFDFDFVEANKIEDDGDLMSDLELNV